MFTFSLLLTIYAGFIHAFEADHLLAVGNIVSQRNSVRLSMKDGIFWGLGHASTLFIIGIIIIVFKAAIPDTCFHFFEAIVGLMLVGLAVYRVMNLFRAEKIKIHTHVHDYKGRQHTHKQAHSLAYGVGVIHGLAGSGVLVLALIAQRKTAADGLAYLLIFGAGCIGGMLIAAGLFSIPFSKKMMQAPRLQSFLIIFSSMLCLVYGSKIIYENMLFL